MTEVSKEIAEAIWKAADDGKNATQIATSMDVSQSTVSRVIRTRKAFQNKQNDGEIAPKIGWSTGRVAQVHQWWTDYDATLSNYPIKAAGGEELRTAVRKAMNQMVFLCPHEFAIQALLDHTRLMRKAASIAAPTPETPQFLEAVRRHGASLGRPISGVTEMMTPYKASLPVDCWGSMEKWEEAFGRYYDSTMGLLAAVGVAVNDLLEDAVTEVIDKQLAARGKEPLAVFSLKDPYRGVPPGPRDAKKVLFMAAVPDALAAELVAELLTRVASERPSQVIWAVELIHLRSLEESAHLTMSFLSPTPIELADTTALADYSWTIPEGDDPWKLRLMAIEAGVAFEEVSKAAMQGKEHLTALLQ